MTSPARFYGIGVGPGDPELLTLKAARILAEVDWIFLPATRPGGQGFAGRIIEALRLDANKFRPVPLGMSLQRSADLEAYAHAAEQIAIELRRGKSAAWIAEGDPLFYSTFVHVWTALRGLAPEIAIEIVPGITSIQAAAACAAIPIAVLEEKVAVLPAAYGLDDLTKLLDEFTTVFLLKVNGIFDRFLDELALLPVPPEAYYVEKVGTAEERVVRDLESLRGKQLPYFSLVILRRGRERRP